MIRITSLGLGVLVIGAVLGLLGQGLFYSAGLGVNVAVWVVALLAGVFVATQRTVLRQEVGYGVALLVGAVGVAINDSPWVVGLNLSLLLGTLGLYAVRSRHASLSWTRGFGAIVFAWTQFWLEAFKLKRDIPWANFLPTSGNRQALRAVGRGVALAVPALLIFVGLLASADPLFSRALTPQISIDGEQVVARGCLAVLMGLFGMGVVRRAAWSRIEPPAPPIPDAVPRSPLGWIEFVTVFSLLSMVLAMFIGVQARYLFGGSELILQTEGLSYASYARRGFFELASLVAIAVPILLGAYSLTKAGPTSSQVAMRVSSVVYLGLISAVLISAGRRMHLYVDVYGLSELRFYVSVSMVWLGLLITIVMAAVVRTRLQHLPRAVVVSVVSLVALVSVANPDRLIAEYNLSRGSGEVVLDHTYLATLGGGAVPAVLRAMPGLPPDEQRLIWEEYRLRYGGADRDWRDWNLRQSTARDAYRRASRVSKLVPE